MTVKHPAFSHWWRRGTEGGSETSPCFLCWNLPRHDMFGFWGLASDGSFAQNLAKLVVMLKGWYLLQKQSPLSKCTWWHVDDMGFVSSWLGWNGGWVILLTKLLRHLVDGPPRQERFNVRNFITEKLLKECFSNKTLLKMTFLLKVCQISLPVHPRLLWGFLLFNFLNQKINQPQKKGSWSFGTFIFHKQNSPLIFSLELPTVGTARSSVFLLALVVLHPAAGQRWKSLCSGAARWWAVDQLTLVV